MSLCTAWKARIIQVEFANSFILFESFLIPSPQTS